MRNKKDETRHEKNGCIRDLKKEVEELGIIVMEDDGKGSQESAFAALDAIREHNKQYPEKVLAEMIRELRGGGSDVRRGGVMKIKEIGKLWGLFQAEMKRKVDIDFIDKTDRIISFLVREGCDSTSMAKFLGFVEGYEAAKREAKEAEKR